MHQGAGADCTMCDVFGNYKQVGSVLDAVCKAAYAFHAMELVQFYAITPMPISTSNCFAAHEQILVLFAL